MIPWKHRMYAFLLRRVLGPFLDEASLRQLHESLDVSLSSGRCSLTDISLNAEYLREKLKSLPVTVRFARIQRLAVQIQLQEHTTTEPSGCSSSSSSSLAWRALQLGSTTSDETASRVSLSVHVELEGLWIELEPHTPVKATTMDDDSTVSSPTEEEAPKSMLASYMEAALSSLELSVDFKNLVLRLWSGENNEKESWTELRLQSAAYNTVPNSRSAANCPPDMALNYDTTLHKALTLQQITVLVGESEQNTELSSERRRKDCFRTTIALLEGTSRVAIRVIEYSSTDNPSHVRTQQDLEVTLQQKFNVSVDETSLETTRRIVQCVQRAAALVEATVAPSSRAPVPLPESKQDREDISTLTSIMKQYQQARQQVERNEMRGGILVPSRSEMAGGSESTFDVFFDANDKSFYHYSTVLRESIVMGGSSSRSASKDDWVHTRLRFHLQDGGIKVAFPSDGIAGRRHEEYILLSISDLNLSSSLSSRSQDHSFSIDRIEIEDSVLIASDTKGALSRRVEIESLLRFSPESDSDLLVQSPCLSMTVSCHQHKHNHSFEVELELDPIEITYRAATMRNLSRLSEKLLVAKESSGGKSKKDVQSSEKDDTASLLRLSAVCPSVSIELPLARDEGNWGGLFKRCGYECPLSRSKKPSFGARLDNFSVDVNQNKSQSGEDALIGVSSIFLFASVPQGGNVLERRDRRFDILALSGRAEVAPCIPVSIKVWQDCTTRTAEGDKAEKSPGETTFPYVPLISSFKARQEDEDEDLRVDRVLCSKLRDIDVSTRKQLRGVDSQVGMLKNAAQSDTVISVHVPEIITDLTSEEIAILHEMALQLMTPVGEQTGSTPRQGPQKAKTTSIALVFDAASISLHEHLAPGQSSLSPSSFSLKANTIKIHALSSEGKIDHTRFLCHDFHFCHVDGLVQPFPPEEVPDARSRTKKLRRRSFRREGSITMPIFYRSQLFEPISRSSPAILMDLVFPSSSYDDLVERTVHCTLYDISYRFDYDSSNWIGKLRNVLSLAFPDKSNRESDRSSEVATNAPCSLTKVFFTAADCNLDYSSPSRYKTAARILVRVGDVRFSSNMVSPATRNQAFSLSIGDVAVYLCNKRFPYNFENSRLIGAASLMRPDQVVLGFLKSSRQNFSPEKVQREMNYRTVLMLDSLDAVLVVANAKPQVPSEPYHRLSLTIGEVGLYTCKDSFARFIGAIGEISVEMAALDDVAFAALKATPPFGDELFYDSIAEESEAVPNDPSQTKLRALDDLKKQSALRPTPGTDADHAKDFLLDGYDWTTIDKDEDNSLDIPWDEEQAARWYKKEDSPETKEDEASHHIEILPGLGTKDMGCQRSPQHKAPRIFAHHFPLQPVSDPLGDGDMDAPKYAGSSVPPQVRTRILVHDLSVKMRCFDGFDWPELLDEESRGLPRKGPFLIDEPELDKTAEMKHEMTKSLTSKLDSDLPAEDLTRKAKLMGDLLAGPVAPSETFDDVPLPEDKGRTLKEQADFRRLARRTGKYFQFSASGVNVRIDSIEDSRDHRLASCLNLTARDFFVAETISSDRPVKMAGEWVSDQEHPRDTKDGLLAVKMVTWHAANRVTTNNEIANDESKLALRLLPLRCCLDQRAIRFARSFFAGDGEEDVGIPPGLHAVPPPLFESFRVRPFKLKVDYKPERIDTKALRDGAFVELINLSPLDGMVLTLQEVSIENEVGFGAVVGILVRRWIQDICATQLLKFLSSSRPLEPFTHVGGSAVDLVVLPWEALQHGEDIRRGLRAGAASFAGALAYEAFTLTSRMTEFFAEHMSTSGQHGGLVTNRMLPSRPIRVPRTVTEASPHAVESLSRGFQAASYKIVIVPYREYHRSGAQGAARSVLRGIPVAIAAPASGVAEALSFALLGIRNQIRPDIRREEEASLRGLHHLEDR